MTFLSEHILSVASIIVIGFLAVFVYAGCSSVVVNVKDVNASVLPQKQKIPEFIPNTTTLGIVYADELEAHKGESGAFLLSDGTQAFLHRVALTRMAQKTIFLQSYIYKDEFASKIFMHELWEAANRGVQVRILIDDNGLDSDFSDIITLDSHPNIEVKIFNPYKNRSKLLRYPEMIYDFSRINRRMHNKVFIVDNTALIIGGRNVADDYFDNNTHLNFTDTDVVFIGDVAKSATKSFMKYWEYERSIPATLLPSKRSMKNYIKEIEAISEKIATQPSGFLKYDETIKAFMQDYITKQFDMAWGKAMFIADTPDKIDKVNPNRPITDALKQIFAHTTKDVYIAAAYFVPGKHTIGDLQSLQDRNIHISVLTNSLASTDSLVVYAAWERYRDIFVKNGVRVYEYQYEGKKKKSGVRGKLRSGASLHSKTIVFDERITWVGSFNLDQRSSNLNTESVVVFENPSFAKKTKANIQEEMADAWQLWCIDDKIFWKGYNKNGEFEIHQKSPNANILLRLFNVLAKVLPEDQV